MESNEKQNSIVIRFAGPGSAQFDIATEGLVSPGQMVAAAEFLHTLGQMQYSDAIMQNLMQQQALKQMGSIAVARANVPPPKGMKPS